MIKIVLFLALSSRVFAFSSELRLLQEHYYKEVTVNSVYKDRFEHFLSKNCDDNDHRCEKALLRKLKNDFKLFKDEKLTNIYEQRLAQTLISESYWGRVEKYLKKQKYSFERSQFITFVDLSKQWLLVLLWYQPHQSFYLLGNDLISSGDMEREANVTNGEDHYLKTPVGLFQIQSGWRSKGKTLDESGTMPYGQKDRFVFFFGKQQSIRYNTFDANGSKISDKESWPLITDELSFAIHAHKSSTYLGKPFSHGCIRMSNDLNLFLDNNLVLHDKVLDDTTWISTSANPPKNPKNYHLAGSYLIVVDGL